MFDAHLADGHTVSLASAAFFKNHFLRVLLFFDFFLDALISFVKLIQKSLLLTRVSFTGDRFLQSHLLVLTVLLAPSHLSIKLLFNLHVDSLQFLLFNQVKLGSLDIEVIFFLLGHLTIEVDLLAGVVGSLVDNLGDFVHDFIVD